MYLTTQRRGERRAVRSPPDAASLIHAPPPLDEDACGQL